MRFITCLALFFFAVAFSAAAADRDSAPLALNGACPVCLIDAGHVSQGSADISQVYKGYTYQFPKQKVKDKFNSNPDRYAIQMDGYSPVSRADGKDEKGDPAIYSVHNHRIYIFKDAKQKTEFERHPDEYVEERRAARPAHNTGS
jgi:YHS domain-containing protein